MSWAIPGRIQDRSGQVGHGARALGTGCGEAVVGVSQPTLYEWIKRYSLPESDRIEQQGQSAEIRRLKMELKRVTEERDILKKTAAYFAKESR